MIVGATIAGVVLISIFLVGITLFATKKAYSRKWDEE